MFRKAIERLHPGDIVIARLNGVGYVGVGRVMSDATPARDFRVPKFAKAAQIVVRALVWLIGRGQVRQDAPSDFPLQLSDAPFDVRADRRRDGLRAEPRACGS